MSSTSKLLKDNGSLPLPLESSFNALAPPPLTPNVMFAWISVTTAYTAQCTLVQRVERPPLAMQHIIVWRSNVISVFDGDILTASAILGSVEDVMPWDMWSMTVQSASLPNQILATLTMGHTLMMTTSTPLWMTTREVKYIEPGVQMYKGGNVTISFVSHVFFLVSVVHRPYFHFTPLHEEVDLYLLAFPHSYPAICLPL